MKKGLLVRNMLKKTRVNLELFLLLLFISFSFFYKGFFFTYFVSITF